MNTPNPLIEALDKLSLKEIFGPLTAPKEKRRLCVIYGVADAYKLRATDAGQQITFTGQFEAVESIAGSDQMPIDSVEQMPRKKWTAPRAILPSVYENQLMRRIFEASGEKRAEFAVEFSIEPRKNAVGYEITYTHILQPQKLEIDLLARSRTAVDTHFAPPVGNGG
jgi:hypothetical protein